MSETTSNIYFLSIKLFCIYEFYRAIIATIIYSIKIFRKGLVVFFTNLLECGEQVKYIFNAMIGQTKSFCSSEFIVFIEQNYKPKFHKRFFFRTNLYSYPYSRGFLYSQQNQEIKQQYLISLTTYTYADKSH